MDTVILYTDGACSGNPEWNGSTRKIKIRINTLFYALFYSII